MKPHRLGLVFITLSMGLFFLGSLPMIESTVPAFKVPKAYAYDGKAVT